jgi:hypothetical protein
MIPQKWDAKLAKRNLESAPKKEQKFVRLLEAVSGNFSVTSTCRSIARIHGLKNKKKRAVEIAEYQLTEVAFNPLAEFCKSITDASWRPMTKEEIALQLASQKFHSLKKARITLEWVAQINTLPEQEQAHTACVIWWDIIGDIMSGERQDFSYFDKWIVGFKPHQMLASEVLRKNLVTCGYPPLIAERRIAEDDVEELETEETEEE